MTNIADSDASIAADNVVQYAPYPFWLGTVLITAQEVVGFDGEQLSGAFLLTPSMPLYISGAMVIEGSASLEVVSGTGAPVRVPATDSLSPSFTYTITQRLATPDSLNPAPVTGVAIPHTLGPVVDISQLL